MRPWILAETNFGSTKQHRYEVAVLPFGATEPHNLHLPYGTDTLEAAKMAADRGVRIYVVGLGTVDGAAATPEGLPIYVQLDEPTLREVARMTAGEYHYAGTAESLRSVYENLGSRMQVLTRETEVTALAALVSALLMLVAAALSVLWLRRIV